MGRALELQQFYNKWQKNELVLVLTKVIDDILMADTPTTIVSFVHKTRNVFDCRKVIVDNDLKFNECCTRSLNGEFLELKVKGKFGSASYVHVSNKQNRLHNAAALATENGQCSSFATSFMRLGSATSQSAASFTFFTQKNVLSLRVANLIEANNWLKPLKDQFFKLKYLSVQTFQKISVVLFSNGAFNSSDLSAQNQTGVSTGLQFGDNKRSSIYWTWQTQNTAEYVSHCVGPRLYHVQMPMITEIILHSSYSRY